MESVCVETSGGLKIHARVFSPKYPRSEVVIVLVHPYTILGGFQGLLRGMAEGLAAAGYKAMTFDMRGAGKSTGWASLTGSAEVEDVIEVCRWAAAALKADGIVLVGSSAGAPIAGSALDKVEEARGYVAIGYPFGRLASVLFGRHHGAVLGSGKPKLFVMGSEDGFTSVKQLREKVKGAAGRAEINLIDGAGHFQMEGPAFDADMVGLISAFVSSL
ncbi:alpha/beta-Hydrolases superfamily protein [Wolffia australiana]